MVRTQIQLTEEQAAALRAMSAARQLSMAELIRISIDRHFTEEASFSPTSHTPLIVWSAAAIL